MRGSERGPAWRLGAAGCAWALLCAAQGTVAGPYPVPVGMAFRDSERAPELVVIPAGRFEMGSTEAETLREQRAPETAATERPLHEVVFEAPLAVGRFDVTRAEFDRFVKATRRTSVFEGCTVDDHGAWRRQAANSYLDPLFAQRDDHPAVCVTWADANDYARWLTQETGHRYRLLREAEWEYAARAGSRTARWWGRWWEDGAGALCAHANGADQSFDRTYPGFAQANRGCDDGHAGTSPGNAYPANPFGLHDMLGNAWQWVEDCYRPRYDAAPPDDSACARRVIRGGSWHNEPSALRSAARFSLEPGNRSSSIGFRIAREADRPDAPP